jgi:predicted dehydrogenase
MTVRIGVLGAARITRGALLVPAAATEGISVAAIAARDPERAHAYARWHRIPQVHSSYLDVLNDDELDAVYIPTPAALHGRWTLSALSASKHVLVEKPFAANSEEARRVEAATAASGLVVMEAHHTTFHPIVERLRAIVADGVLGEVQRVSSWFHAPIPPGSDIRWNSRLGGGSLMDLGCYPIRLVRDVLGEPVVKSAVALRRGDIDRRMTARLEVSGVDVTIDCGLWSSRFVGAGFAIEGSRAALRCSSPFHPQFGGRLRIDGRGIRHRESPSRKSTYRFQLEAFRDAIVAGTPNTASPSQAVATMAVIDDIYRAAGMSPRLPL